MIIKTDVAKSFSYSPIEQLSIYEQLIPGIKIGKAVKSPLRTDDNPSFCIYVSKRSGNVYWKDFGTGEGGTIADLQRLLRTPQIAPKRGLKKTILTATELDYLTRSWTEADLELWLKWGIDDETLSYYNVNPVRSVLTNGYESWRSTPTNPIYAYTYGSSFKLYRPLGLKANKWRSKVGSKDDVQGLEQYKPSDILIITKSLKDVMVLHTLGYASVAPASETTFIDENVYKKLVKTAKKVYLLFDNDKTGIARSNKLCEDHKELIPIFIPRESRCKDISDFVAKYSSLEGIKLLKELIQ